MTETTCLITDRIGGICRTCGKDSNPTHIPPNQFSRYCKACCPLCSPKVHFQGEIHPISGNQGGLFE
jgi:hypothetical protein